MNMITFANNNLVRRCVVAIFSLYIIYPNIGGDILSMFVYLGWVLRYILKLQSRAGQ